MLDRAAHTVLVVDDHEATRYATARNLRGGGYQVIEASTGGQALDMVQDASAMVLDVHLPDIDGFEVCRRVRARDDALQDLPVIHVSSVHVTGFAQAKGHNVGADAYLITPVRREQLLQVLDELLQR
jgi:CheY-like chemotaxis protein